MAERAPNTVRIVPQQDHDGLLTIGEALDASYEGYYDRADDTEQVRGLPKQTVFNPDSGVRSTHFIGDSPRMNAGGSSLFAKLLDVDSDRQEELAHTGTMYALFDDEACEYTGVLIGELAPEEFPSRGRRSLTTALESTVGTDVLAREDATDVAVLGSGRQARSHLACFTEIRDLETARVYSPTRAHREAYAEEMSADLDVDVTAVDSTDRAIDGADIVLVATNASSPVFDGDLLEPGQHVVSIVGSEVKLVRAGMAPKIRREIDDRTVERADVYVANSIHQATQSEQGDFVEPIEHGIITWDDVVHLPDIVADRHPGRESDRQITVYKQNSIQSITHTAVAARFLEEAEERDLGTVIEWFDPRAE